MEWIFATDAAKALDGKKTYNTWQQGFLQILEYVLDNRELVMNTYHSIRRDRLEQYLYDVTYDLLKGVVEEKSIGMKVREEDKDAIANFYKFGFVGLMLEWIKSGMKEKPEHIIEQLSILMKGNITRALEKYRSDH